MKHLFEYLVKSHTSKNSYVTLEDVLNFFGSENDTLERKINIAKQSLVRVFYKKDVEDFHTLCLNNLNDTLKDWKSGSRNSSDWLILVFDDYDMMFKDLGPGAANEFGEYLNKFKNTKE